LDWLLRHFEGDKAVQSEIGHLNAERTLLSRLLDLAWQQTFRIAFRLARIWWKVRRHEHEGALVAIYIGRELLLVQSSYRTAWNFPGGGIRSGESPEAAARRELAEEIGLILDTAILATQAACSIWEKPGERVYIFELRLDRLPDLRLDNREILAVRLVSPAELQSIPLTKPVLALLRERLPEFPSGAGCDLQCVYRAKQSGRLC
jgi:8-oxo-dGTP diphosphatase